MAKKYNSEDEKALKEFLLDEECLEALLPWTQKFNIFDILKISRTEIRHSNMLGWLLDPNENHGLGDKFLKALFQIVVSNSEKHDVFELLLMDYKSFIVLREWKNIDLLLVSKKEKVLLAIENKIGSHEHSDQLNRYKTILEEDYADYKRIYLYLTPEGDLSSDPNNWEALSYAELIEELAVIASNTTLLTDAELMINNYIDIIRRDVLEDQELVEICNKIYQKHKRALELIYENKSDSRSANTDLFLDALKQYEESGDIVIDKNNTGNTVINFYTKKMDKYMPQDDSYTNSLGGHSIYRYYLDMKQYPNITMTFELLGLGFDPIYLNIVNEITQICKPGDSRVNFKYKKLYTTKSYTVDEDNIEESCKKNIYSLMQDILKKQDDIISKIE